MKEDAWGHLVLKQVLSFISVRPEGVTMLQSPIGITVHNDSHLERSICSMIFIQEDKKL